ncbi:MAG: amino acid/polyamine transporter I [Monoraphidium minutum]|nr:MAG: amino acid/polyamine transporter I [Monoraphidium minutum]
MATDPSVHLAHKDEVELAKHEDEIVLARLGYKQVLYRTWGTVTAVALTISAMSTLTSVSASFYYGLAFGGPAVCIWGWIVVSAATLCVGLGMAELASAYPTSGGMYYWQFRLAGRKFGPWACWVTGWLNLLGQIAAVSAVAALAAGLTATMITMATGLNGGTPAKIGPKENFGLFAGFLLLNALVNGAGLGFLTICTQARGAAVGAFFNLAGVVLLCLIVPLAAVDRQPASYVFTAFEPGYAESVGITNPFNVAILGLLLPAYSYTGVDGPVHMAEEVNGSETAPSIAILYGISIMFVGGLSMVIALLFSMKSLDHVLDENNESGGDPIPQILYDVFKDRFNNPAAGIALQIIPILAVFFCLVATTTYVTRILFCYSRDGAVPLSGLWQRVDKRTRTPQAALWCVSLLALCLGLPMLGSETAFNAILSLSTISLIVAYSAPIAIRITVGAKRFEPGPFSLGKWAYPIGVVAVTWAAAATVIFCLPTEMPVTVDNLNYASVALVGTFLISNIWFFFPKYGAYKWFRGPARTVDTEDSVMDIGDASMAGKGVVA